MADAEQLRNLILTGFEQLSAPWQGYADALAGRARTDIERENEDRAKAIIENTYGRGLGLSTIATQMQEARMRARDEAVAKARVDAETAAREAQLAALGQAAGVVNSEMNRRQQAGQYERDYGLRERALNQQGEQSRATLRQQRNASNTSALASGLGGLGTAALQMTGLMFADKFREWMKGTGGGTSSSTGGGGLTIGGDPGPDIAPGATLNPGAPFATTPAPTFSYAPATSTDFGLDYQAPAGGFDTLSNAYDSGAFAPFDATTYITDWGDYGGGFDTLSSPSYYDSLWRNSNWGWG